MKKLVLRAVAPTVAVLALAGSVLAALDQLRWALAISLLIVGAGAALAAETYRKTVRTATASRLDAVAAGVTGRVDRLEERTNRRLGELGDRVVSGDRTLSRLEAAEKRLLLSVERVRFSVEDLAPLVEDVGATVRSVDTELSPLVREVSSTVRSVEKRQIRDRFAHRDAIVEAVRNMDATLQLLPLVSARAPLPPTGGWAISARNLLLTVTLARTTTPRTILELGSGTSTIWLGYVAVETGARVVALEHLDQFAEATRAELDRHGLAHAVEVRTAPLVPVTLPSTNQPWYDVSALGDLDQVELLLVDGPPESTGPAARYPALPALVDRLADEAWIVLDDAAREGEAESIERWLAEVPGLSLVPTSSESLAFLRFVRPIG